EELERKWQKDVHKPNSGTCPNCHTLLGCGTAGIMNLVKTHYLQPCCVTAKVKWDKERAQPKNSTMTSFFSKAPAKRQLVPSTVQAPALVTSGSIVSKNPTKITPKTLATPSLSTSESASGSSTVRLLNQLTALVDRLPAAVEAADDTNPLSAFSADPASYVSALTKPGDLWEELNPIFHRAFDYSIGPETVVTMIQRGALGVDGLLSFLKYFVGERGLEGGMVDRKIEQVIEAVQSVLKNHGISDLIISGTPKDQRARTVIDVDAEANPQPTVKPIPTKPRVKSTPSVACAGFAYPFGAPGETAGSHYPYMLHDVLTVPWTFTGGMDGTLTLRSTHCQKVARSGCTNCSACANLPHHVTLAGILDRAKYGVKEHAGYAYHSFSGLVEVIKRKGKRIEELRMRGMNAAKHIAVQARALSDHKRFLRAIGSGSVENVDRLVKVQLGRGQGIRGVIATHDKRREKSRTIGCASPVSRLGTGGGSVESFRETEVPVNSGVYYGVPPAHSLLLLRRSITYLLSSEVVVGS
ncbi:hypothetical protein C8R47DRAFT_1284367, partial [Mycena vitilis]